MNRLRLGVLPARRDRRTRFERDERNVEFKETLGHLLYVFFTMTTALYLYRITTDT